MRIIPQPKTGLLVLVSFSLLASSVVTAADAQMITGQAGAIAPSATSEQMKAESVKDAVPRPEQPLSEPAPSSPVRPKGERPKLGLCDGS